MDGEAAPPWPFVVTGCPRSGTHYLSDVLTRAGVPCRHEAVFGPYDRSFRGFGAALGDSSWLAMPFLADVPPETVILHQTRHPLDVVRSLLGIRFLDDVPAWRESVETSRARLRWWARTLVAAPLRLPGSSLGPRPLSAFRQFVHDHAPEIYAEATPAERALRMWVAWNRGIVARAGARPGYLRYRVEDLDDALLSQLVASIGSPLSRAGAAVALTTSSQERNSRRRAAVEWADLPSGPARQAAEMLAAEYGYVPGRTLHP